MTSIHLKYVTNCWMHRQLTHLRFSNLVAFLGQFYFEGEADGRQRNQQTPSTDWVDWRWRNSSVVFLLQSHPSGGHSSNSGTSTLSNTSNNKPNGWNIVDFSVFLFQLILFFNFSNLQLETRNYKKLQEIPSKSSSIPLFFRCLFCLQGFCADLMYWEQLSRRQWNHEKSQN